MLHLSSSVSNKESGVQRELDKERERERERETNSSERERGGDG